MKKWKQAVILAVLAFAVIFAAKAEASAAGQITGVKQTDASTSSVTIEWEDPSLASNYFKVELSTDKVNWGKVEHTSRTNEFISGLSAGKTYYARVTGYNDYSYSTGEFTGLTAEPSEIVEVVTAPDCKNLSVVQSGASTTGISAKFGDVMGANYFQLVYSENSQETILGESASATVKTSIALEPGKAYWMDCYACNKSASGFVARGTRDYVKMKTNTKKPGSSQFGITNAWTTLNSYRFGVDAATLGEFDGYQFQFQTPGGKTKKSASNEGSYSVTVDNFINNNFYKYRVRTYVNCGADKAYSAWSPFRYVGIVGKVTTNSRSSALNFSWSKVANASKYVVYISTKENSGYKKVKTAKPGNRSLSITKFNGKKISRGKYYIKIYTYAKVGGKQVKSDVVWAGSYTRY